MRKPLEKAAKVLLRNPKLKRCVQTTRDQSVAVQSSHPNPRALVVEPLSVECPFKARQSPFNAPVAVERELGNTNNSHGKIVGHKTKEFSYRNDRERSYNYNEMSTIAGTATIIPIDTTVPIQTTTATTGLPKPFSSIPTQRGLPIIGTLLDFIKAGGTSQLHEYTRQRHNQLGPIFVENLGGSKILFLSDPTLYKDVQKYEGSFPASLKPDSFHVYNKVNLNRLCGLFIMEGEEWWTHRKKSHQTLLRYPPEFNPGLLDSYDDFVSSTMKAWGNKVQNNSGQLLNPEYECQKLGFQGLCHILLGYNFVSNWKKLNADIFSVIKCSNGVVKGMDKLQAFPPGLARILKAKAWTDFESSLDKILRLTKDMTELCIDDLKSIKPEEGYRQGGMLYKLSTETDFNRQSLLDVTVGLASPVDPPGVTIMWLLWSLGQYPEVQKKIYEEINQVCGPRTEVSSSHLENLNYVKMVLKESMRLKPTTPFLARVLPAESVIGGYAIPAGQVVSISVYASHLNPKYFPDPLLFWPERWSREVRQESNLTRYSSFEGVTDPGAYIPFGVGKRACVGRVVGRSMLQLMIAKVVQNFEVQSDYVNTKMKPLMVPDRPMNIRLKKRTDAP